MIESPGISRRQIDVDGRPDQGEMGLMCGCSSWARVDASAGDDMGGGGQRSGGVSDAVVLITGGCGFLGVSTAARLLAQAPDRRIVLSDIVRHPRMERLSGDVTFVAADLSDPEASRQLVTRDVGTVFHYASLVSGGAERDFVAGFNANVRATINLLEACRERGACPRFVFTSSISTFGGRRLPAVGTNRGRWLLILLFLQPSSVIAQASHPSQLTAKVLGPPRARRSEVSRRVLARRLRPVD